MTHSKYGFTVVEVLIVISVIGILASIAIVSWNGVALNNRNNLRVQDINQWSATFDTYKGRFAAYPIMPPPPTGTPPAPSWVTYCLGSFANTNVTSITYNGKCGAFTSPSEPQAILATKVLPGTTSTILTQEIAKIGKVPGNDEDLAVGGKLAGPIVYTSRVTNADSSITVTAQIINFFENTCPAGLVDVSSVAPASDMLTAATVTGAIACKLNPDKTFTFGP